MLMATIGAGCISFDSYIKPQQNMIAMAGLNGCISFDSYIKPQLPSGTPFVITVVYLLIPTSNHNLLVSSLNHQSLYIF